MCIPEYGKRVGRGWLALGVSLALIFGASGCSRTQPGTGSGPTASPSLSATPEGTGTPAPMSDQELFENLTARYEKEVGPEDNGYPVVEPILNGELPEGLGQDIYEVSLDTPEQQKTFDTKLLPLLKSAFSKPDFAAEGKLMAGETEINYRGLRQLVTLLTTRAEQMWDSGDKEGALGLAELPISLSRAMRSRPETASVNLFSSNYAEGTLGLISGWVESGTLDTESVKKLRHILGQGSPEFAHLKETVSVDFAQLLNSLDTESGRELLGIGYVEKNTLKHWREQLLEIHDKAVQLYQLEPLDAAAFNQSVLAAPGPIQGLVIDYPEVSTMQKHSFARYKATEIGLSLLESEKSASSKSEQLIEDVLRDDPETETAVKALVEVKTGEGAIRVVGRPGQFEMLAPGVEPVFFEYQKSSPAE